jgi:tungstate transport system permease protein
MRTLLDALTNVAGLIVSFDASVVQYALRSLSIALIATCIAGVLAVPVGVLIAERSFPGKRALVTVLNTLLGVPTVVVGLLVFAFISRSGPLGDAGLLFTVRGIIIGEVLLILPLATSLVISTVTRVDRDIRKTAMSLGARETRVLMAILREARYGILAAVIAAFGRVVGEVGVATILGGNAERFTRTMTTAIVLNVDAGSFELALALGIVLLIVSLAVNIVFQLLQGGGRE